MSDQFWTWQCDRVIPSDVRAGRQVVDEVLLQLKAQHWAPRDVFGVHLALHEALINAITHGNHQDANKQVHISCRLSPDLVRIEITDEGAGFDPAKIPDPTSSERLTATSGRGVLLMKAFMNRVEYNVPGNRVILEKTRRS
jgi:serine/threonine-protein kinase RsbW